MKLTVTDAVVLTEDTEHVSLSKPQRKKSEQIKSEQLAI